jgi:hypothetical protein
MAVKEAVVAIISAMEVMEKPWTVRMARALA